MVFKRTQSFFYFLFIVLGFKSIVECKKMKLDKSKSTDFKCNDHLDRLYLDFNIDQNFLLKNQDLYFGLNYAYYPCQSSSIDSPSTDCDLKNLTTLNYDNKKSLNIFLNSYYKYKLQINSVKLRNTTEFSLDLNSTRLVCNNLNYTKFEQCEYYVLNVYSLNNCSLTLVRHIPSYSFVKYIYLAIVLVVAIVVIAKFIKMSFFKYRSLK